MYVSPLPEFRVKQTIGESFPADTDTLQYSVAPQLLEDQISLEDSGLL